MSTGSDQRLAGIKFLSQSVDPSSGSEETFDCILFHRCQQRLIECSALEDSYETLLTCDNSQNSESTLSCVYTDTQGTEYSDAALESMAISTRIADVIQV